MVEISLAGQIPPRLPVPIDLSENPEFCVRVFELRSLERNELEAMLQVPDKKGIETLSLNPQPTSHNACALATCFELADQGRTTKSDF